MIKKSLFFIFFIAQIFIQNFTFADEYQCGKNLGSIVYTSVKKYTGSGGAPYLYCASKGGQWVTTSIASLAYYGAGITENFQEYTFKACFYASRYEMIITTKSKSGLEESFTVASCDSYVIGG